MYENIVRAFGVVFDNRVLYGITHKVTVQSLEQAFEHLSQALATEGALLLTISPDECHINQQLVETRTPLMLRFVDLLRAHELSTLTMKNGLTPEEFIGFMDLIAQPPQAAAGAGGIAEKLREAPFTHIESRKVTYVEINDDEIVVSKELLGEQGSTASRNTAVMEYLGVFDEGKATQTAPSDAVGAGMQELLGNPGELGQIILQSAGASLSLEFPWESPLPESVTQTLIDRIVKCLERAFGVMKEERSARSQKGKKALIKSLKALESDLDAVIREVITPIGENDLAPIGSAIDAMTDELAIDALASEYLRKRKLIESSEARMLSYMERRGEALADGELRNRLIEGGLPPQNWEMLLLTSGAMPMTQAHAHELSTGIPGFTHLQEMLGQLAKCFQDIGPEDAVEREKLEALIAQVEGRLKALIKNTQSRMENLLKRVVLGETDQTKAGREASQKPSQRQVLEMLAEIVQELCQPLSVVQCAVDVLVAGQMGTLSTGQQNLLELASRSATRLSALINELYSIVGPPTDLVPKGRAGVAHP